MVYGREFSSKLKEAHDDWSGRRTEVSDEVIEMVQREVILNRGITVREHVAHILGSSNASVERPLTEKLGYVRYYAQWVQRLLTADYKAKHLNYH